MQQALLLPSPYSPTSTHDEDLTFAMQAAGVWGPYLSAWRDKQRASLNNLRKALAHVNDQLVERMDPYVHMVASERFPAGMAASVILLRWPDRKIPVCFTEGFSVIGNIEESGIFRRLPDIKEPVDLNSAFYGKEAKDFVNTLEDLKATPIPKNAEKLETMVNAELKKGRFYNPMSRAQADIFFGEGEWRPMPLFIVEQTNKDRFISDAKRGGHNSVVSELEKPSSFRRWISSRSASSEFPRRSVTHPGFRRRTQHKCGSQTGHNQSWARRTSTRPMANAQRCFRKGAHALWLGTPWHMVAGDTQRLMD